MKLNDFNLLFHSKSSAIFLDFVFICVFTSKQNERKRKRLPSQSGTMKIPFGKCVAERSNKFTDENLQFNNVIMEILVNF